MACISTGAIAMFGVLEMIEAAWTAFGDLNHIHEGNDLFISGILKGLECFFLAPMPLLLAFAIRDLIPAYKNSSLDCPGSDEEKTKNIENAHFKLQKLKTVIIGLMATAMAANVLKQSFGKELDLQNIIPNSILLLLLFGYAYTLDRHGK